MPLSIKSREADQLARELADVTGETITDAVVGALREKLERQRRRQRDPQLMADLIAIADHCASLPVLNDLTEDEIMGWDENGLPT
jgi:antitoxin VapB